MRAERRTSRWTWSQWSWNQCTWTWRARPGARRALARAAALALCLAAADARADETCQSPFLPKIAGQEDYIYVWTLGIEGIGDGSDKLVTVGANPAREDYGKVVASHSVGGRHEAHHAGLTDDRRNLWLGGLDSSKIWIFDVATDPARPKLAKTIDDFVEKTGGVVGPHGFYALPGRMLISALSNAEDLGGRTALVEYSNAGEHIRTDWMPEGAEYGYDARVNAHLNRLLTSSFTGKKSYMRPLRELLADALAMKQFGNTMVLWDFHARKPLQTFEVPGAPLEIRWALGPRSYYAFTAAALTSRLWGVFRKDDGSFEAVDLAPIGDPAQTPLPVDISLSADDRFLFVSTFTDGKVRVLDVSNPRAPRQVYEKKIGAQVNMVSQSWDGKRVYFTSSLLANWDGISGEDPQFLRAYTWDGAALAPTFELDFRKAELGRPHMMSFGKLGMYAGAAGRTVSRPAEGAPAERAASGGEASGD
jgi:selenium-binding protein 1